MTTDNMNQLLNTCVALSAERDREELLSRILDTAMDLTSCDGGTLYLLEDNGLSFCRMVTRSFGIRQGGHGSPITLPPVPLKNTHVCARAVLESAAINVSDVRADDRFDFSGTAKYDAMTGYTTRSMMVVPLTDDKGKIIGVLQLINAMDEDNTIIPFSKELELVVTALASQVAISLTNMQYAERVQKLLDSLVRALSAAIDQRTPYNANHSRNMARYADQFLAWLEQSDSAWILSPEEKRAFLMSVWLHDVGKLTVPLSVMDKESRLSGGIERVEQRFRIIKLLTQNEMLRGTLPHDEGDARLHELDEAMEFIRRINSSGFLPDHDLAMLNEIATRTFSDEEGVHCPWITADELTALSVRKGTLTAEERKIMEDHVTVTARILDQVSFPEEYSKVPEWAAAHHELLNGNGYPQHRTADTLPREVRLLTILDVFDALTATDRPYKPPMPVAKALSILHSMVDEGAIDGEILKLFETSKAWEGTL